MSESNIIRPDFGKEVAETAELVDLKGTKKKHLASAIQNSLETMQKVYTRERASKTFVDSNPCGFAIDCLSQEAAEIIRRVFVDASRQFPHLLIGTWEMHPHQSAWRVRFLRRHWAALYVVPNQRASHPQLGRWPLGGQA